MTSPGDLLRNNVKEKMARNEVALSMIVRLVRSVEIASLARTAGLDSIYVDLEHCAFSLDTTGQICIACQAVGVTPFVRVPGVNPELIARVMDIGALGVIVTQIQSRQDAEAAVRAAKYPPQGTRSYSAVSPQLQFRTFPTSTAITAINEATMVIAMIETEEALKAAGDIASVDGIDMLFIGTNDLCNAFGIPGQLEHARVSDAFARAQDACSKAGKHLGIGGLASKPDFTRDLVKRGARYISIGSELGFLLGGASEKVKQWRQ